MGLRPHLLKVKSGSWGVFLTAISKKEGMRETPVMTVTCKVQWYLSSFRIPGQCRRHMPSWKVRFISPARRGTPPHPTTGSIRTSWEIALPRAKIAFVDNKVDWFSYEITIRTLNRLGTVIHACNPSYAKGRDWENSSLKPAQAKNSQKLPLLPTSTNFWMK
jgi:hypothetical protein